MKLFKLFTHDCGVNTSGFSLLSSDSEGHTGSASSRPRAHSTEPCTIFRDSCSEQTKDMFSSRGQGTARGTHSEKARGLPGSWRKEGEHGCAPCLPTYARAPPSLPRELEVGPCPQRLLEAPWFLLSHSRSLLLLRDFKPPGDLTLGQWPGRRQTRTLVHCLRGYEMVQPQWTTVWCIFKNEGENCHMVLPSRLWACAQKQQKQGRLLACPCSQQHWSQ